jgi:magnesium-transporting ATPase (P-type)
MIEVAAILSGAVERWGDFYIISFLLLFNAVIGFWEEHEASNALDALRNSWRSRPGPCGTANGRRSRPATWCREM